MGAEVRIPRDAVLRFILAMADDEFVLGHRDSEWTGYAPILEEDIAFSNIAQDEIGHALVWFTLYEEHTGRSPDAMGFHRPWSEFTCSRFVTYPKGDFAYTVVRQYFFDAAEQVRLTTLTRSSYEPFKGIAEKLLREEAYHILHSRGLVERLAEGTEESRRRMGAAVAAAFPQALGMFEPVQDEHLLIESNVFPGNDLVRSEWLKLVVPVLRGAGLDVPLKGEPESVQLLCTPDEGGRRGEHTEHLRAIIEDLQGVIRLDPSASW